MKIVDVQTETYRWPRPKPITNGKHTYTHVTLGLVKILTDSGITGVGLGSAGGFSRVFTERLKPTLLNEDPIDVERLWYKMWVPKLMGRRGLSTQAISTIDIALWDLRAKVAGMPLYKLLGGYRQSVPAYIAGGYYVEGKGLKELAEEMAEFVSWGARAVKMKVGALPIPEDVKRVRAVREAVGPDVKLMVDANCAYRTYEAIQFAHRVEELEPFWFEEPIALDDYEGLSKIAAMTTIPLAVGENEYTRYGFRDLIAQRAVPILNPDANILGGVTEFMKVVALAQVYDLDVSPHGAEEIHVHLMAAIANGLILEFYPSQFEPLTGRVFHHTLQLDEDGMLSPPDVPGIGVEPDYEALAPFRVE